MKSTNRTVCILDIIIVIFAFVFLPNISFDFFEKTIMINRIILYTLLGVINLIVGIKNLKSNNKKNGVASIVISIIIFASNILRILKYVTIDDIYGTINGISMILMIVLIVYSLIVNKKNENQKMPKRILILICILVLMEIMMFAVIVLFTRLNIKNIEKAVQILNEENKKQAITYQWKNEHNEEYCDFYDSNGKLISSEKYKVVSNEKWESNTGNYFCVLTVLENNKAWIVNPEGKKIARIYNMFENIEKSYSFVLACNTTVKKMNYDYQWLTTGKKYCYLKLQSSNNSNYIFGDLSTDGYQLNVVLNNNELEKDTKLKKVYYELFSRESTQKQYSKEQIKIIEDMYKYKKSFYLINMNGERKEINCNNIFFTYDKDGKLVVWTYSNKYIPFYNDNTNGYIDTNGEIFSISNEYIVYDVMKNYKIVYGSEKGYYILSNDNRVLINENPSLIRFHNDNYLITDEYAYIIQGDNFQRITKNKHLGKSKIDSVDFINILENNAYPIPYDISIPFEKIGLYSLVE